MLAEGLVGEVKRTKGSCPHRAKPEDRALLRNPFDNLFDFNGFLSNTRSPQRSISDTHD